MTHKNDSTREVGLKNKLGVSSQDSVSKGSGRSNVMSVLLSKVFQFIEQVPVC